MSATEDIRVLRLRLMKHIQCEKDKKYFNSRFADEFTGLKMDVGHERSRNVVYADVKDELFPIFETEYKQLPLNLRNTLVYEHYILKITLGADPLEFVGPIVHREEHVVAVRLKIVAEYDYWSDDLAYLFGVMQGRKLPMLLDVFDLPTGISPLDVFQVISGLCVDLPLIFPASPKLIGMGDNKDVWKMIMSAHLVLTEESCDAEMKNFLMLYPLKRMIVSSIRPRKADKEAEYTMKEVLNRLSKMYSFIAEVKAMDVEAAIKMTSTTAVKLLKIDCAHPIRTMVAKGPQPPGTNVQLDDSGFVGNNGDSETSSEDNNSPNGIFGTSTSENARELLRTLRDSEEDSEEEDLFDFLKGQSILHRTQIVTSDMTLKEKIPIASGKADSSPIKESGSVFGFTPEGKFQDRNGRWHGPNGRFCNPLDYQVAQEGSKPALDYRMDPRRVTALPSAERRALPTGEYQDRNGRWHDSKGKFCTDPTKTFETTILRPKVKPTEPKLQMREHLADEADDESDSVHEFDHPLSRTAEEKDLSKQDTKMRKNVKPTGEYQDMNGDWHDSNGRFCRDPIGSSLSSPLGPENAIDMRSSYSRFLDAGIATSSLQGYSQDRNGRWHGANGRFSRNPYE